MRSKSSIVIFPLILILFCLPFPDAGSHYAQSKPSRTAANTAGAPNNPFSSEISSENIDPEFLSKWDYYLNPNLWKTPELDGHKQVRVIYLSPSDQPVRDDYKTAIGEAFRQLQGFYRDQVGNGYSFALHSPVVDFYQTTHTAAWYSSNPSRANAPQSLWFWENVLNDGFALTGGGFNDPNNRWIFYVQADTGCGQSIGGNAGVALMAANDLRGLTGQPNLPACASDSPDTFGYYRWVGGAGHELGHSFNLPHPPGCGSSGPNYGCSGGSFAANSLMWVGYAFYPNTYLLPEDKQALLDTGFFYNTVMISGRAVRSDGRGVLYARVSLTDQGGVTRYAITNPFGYYRFNNVDWGRTYNISVQHKLSQFDPKTVTPNSDLTGVDFTEN